MEYLKREDDRIIKYDVNFNWDNLEKIRYENIKKCGMREHQSYDSDYSPRVDPIFIENYSDESIGTKDYFEETRTLYHIEYDLISEPLLAKLIREKNMELLEYVYENKKIAEKDLFKNNKNLKKKILKKLKEMLNKNIDYTKIREYLNQLEEIEKQDQLNLSLNLISQKKYINKIKKEITMEKVDEIDLYTYDKVAKFTKNLKK